jgi:hypothetical protein
LVLERPPAYALERNPVEYIWGYMQQRELANPCLDTIGGSPRIVMHRYVLQLHLQSVVCTRRFDAIVVRHASL